MGRFATPDPSTGVDPGKPYTWNRYAYVHGDPINFHDRSGTNEAACGPEWATDASLSGPCEDDGGGVAGGGYDGGGGGSGFASQYPNTTTDAERKKRQIAIDLAGAVIAATSQPSDPVVPIAIKMKDMCARKG